ncbi:glycosyltransferase family 32 protein [Sphaerobolus stellatus SS14]|uniref:Glycosyltransferase family 32 protein n=1 Tax=Sphaerobolus stellatus (strain SS14) TaxID=990650 RepID=A0A0C9VT76_SPHS4|nr:glycosyltransferase family 32 protein [Sphaerobolus stellatus SS14]
MPATDDMHLPIHTHPIPRSRLKGRRILFAVLVGITFVALISWRHQLHDRFLPSDVAKETVDKLNHLPLAEPTPTADPELPVSTATPLSNLGLDADNSYKIGSTSLPYYEASLEGFIDTAFPAGLKLRLMKQLELYLSTDPNTKLPARPKTIYQTNDVQTDSKNTRSWRALNDGYNYRFMNDDEADEWVRKKFGGSDIEWTWDHLPHIVMKTDFLRYLLLLVEGGVYSDIDTKCLKSISQWGSDPDVKGELRGGEQPGAVIGVEADVGNREDWHQWWSRPVQLVQWTIAFSPGHPILLDTIKRIHDKTKQAQDVLGGALQVIPNEYLADAVLEWTGPAIFTDATFRFLQIEDGIQWPELRGLKKPLRVGSVTILPVTGFSPGVGNFGAQGPDHAQAMVRHDFGGSWKPKHGH